MVDEPEAESLSNRKTKRKKFGVHPRPLAAGRLPPPPPGPSSGRRLDSRTPFVTRLELAFLPISRPFRWRSSLLRPHIPIVPI